MRRLSGFHPAVLALVVVAVAMATIAAGEVAMLNSITFEQEGAETTYLIEYSGEVHHQDFLMSNPQRLVVDLMGARNGLESLTRAGDGNMVKGVRTSQFRNEPSMITRVVFDIEAGTRHTVEQKQGAIVVTFAGSGKPAQPDERPVMGAGVSDWTAPVIGSAPAEDTAPETSSQPVKASKDEPAAPAKPAEPANSWTTSEPSSLSQPQSQPAQPQSQQAPQNTWSQPQAGSDVMVASRSSSPRSAMALGATGGITANKPITLDVQGADMKTVLRSISEFSGANIIAGPEVEGVVTIHLVNVPWKEALDTILRAHGYDYRDEYGIYRVQEMKVLHEEEIAQVSLERKKEEMEPLVSRTVKLSFANAEEMAQAMRDAVTRRGSVQVEKGSNTVIITDIPEYADRVVRMCVDLDRKVGQVEIVAKLVDVDVEATREMGIKWDFLNIQSADINANADAEIGQRLLDPFGAFRVGTVQSWGDLMVAIDALERENKANIVSHPRIVTADNKEASILVGKEIPLIVSDEAGNPITELKKIGVILRVTPHINSDQTITMDIHPEVSELSTQATVQGGVIISLTSADTRVIVGDGETAVIGGLINEVESSLENGLPFLKDVPVLGNLFKYSNRVSKKRELIIFITPKIVG